MEPRSEVDAVVVGAGVVGLACAAALARRGQRVVVVERHTAPAFETSSRNSQVIHAGLYYPPDSLKARLCVEGRRLLYERCAARGIGHRKTGKLVVATAPEEIPALEGLRSRGNACGAGALEMLDAREVSHREPRVRGCAALWSPETGIVDAHELASSFQAEAESHGAAVVFRTLVTGLARRRSLWSVETRRTGDAAGSESFRVEAPWVINAAGLESDRIASLAGLDVCALGWSLHPCKGDYFAVAPSLGRLTEHLVYPTPIPGGVGIHVTFDLGGRFRLGPDVEWVEHASYVVDPAKADLFARAVQRYLPEIRPEHLTPEMAGVRPKLQRPGEPFRDFVIEEASPHGAPGLVNLLGIESPGLTASPAIAEHVAEIVDTE